MEARVCGRHLGYVHLGSIWIWGSGWSRIVGTDIRPEGNLGRLCSRSERNHPSSELGAAEEYQSIGLVMRLEKAAPGGEDKEWHGRELKDKGNYNMNCPREQTMGAGEDWWHRGSQVLYVVAAKGLPAL